MSLMVATCCACRVTWYSPGWPLPGGPREMGTLDGWPLTTVTAQLPSWKVRRAGGGRNFCAAAWLPVKLALADRKPSTILAGDQLACGTGGISWTACGTWPVAPVTACGWPTLGTVAQPPASSATAAAREGAPRG